MTRVEHIKWCKERAFEEFNFYQKDGIKEAIRNGITSMMFDLGKHIETNQEALKMLCIVEMMKCNSRDEFTKFINGFN